MRESSYRGDRADASLIKAMPKAELHLHLDGSLRIDTALDLATRTGVDAPNTYRDMHAALVAPRKTESQADLLSRFALPVALLQDEDAIQRATYELIVDKAADRVRYVEIKWAPSLHTAGKMSIAQVIAVTCEAAIAAEQDTGTIVRLVAVGLRSDDPIDTLAVAEASARALPRLSGFDLAGVEATHPDPVVHRPAFDAARASGLGVTVHAGELPDGGVGVRRALEIGPDRIAHGATAIDDTGLCQDLIDRGVTLDLCPTSNVQAATVVDLSAHPVAKLHRKGVSVTLSTDDATISDTTLSEELQRTVAATGLTTSELWAINKEALDVAFCEPQVIEKLRDAFDAWAHRIPDLSHQEQV